MQTRNQLITKDTNFKEYFLQEDNCRSLQNEVIFSIVRRYNCFAGCKICYVDKYFEKSKVAFQRYIPDEVESMTDKWMDVFKHYRFVTTTDDLYWMKNYQPRLFSWYKHHSDMFHFGAMTDKNFIRAWDILTNEIAQPKGIYEFTFSDVWLSKVRVDEVIEKLLVIHAKMPINQIKLIQTDVNSLNWEPVKKIIQFVKDRDLNLIIHADAKTFNTIQIGSEHQQVSFATHDGDLYTVLGEADYLQYDSFFHTLIDAIDPLCEPYDVIGDKFDPSTHLAKHVKGKIDVYARYVEKLKYAKGDTVNYKNYFEWVSNNLVVNEDYNYIPSLCFKPFHTYYNELLKDWSFTQYGLLRPSESVKPLFEFKS